MGQTLAKSDRPQEHLDNYLMSYVISRLVACCVLMRSGLYPRVGRVLYGGCEAAIVNNTIANRSNTPSTVK